MNVLWLLLGFIILIKGADLFVDGAVSLAKKLHMSPLVIGLTIVAFGTSAPEAAVSFAAAANGYSGITIGNVIGSNLVNGLLVVGVAAFFTPLSVKSLTLKRDLPMLLAASLMLIWMLSNHFFFPNASNQISRIEGVFLIIGFIVFLMLTLRQSKKLRLPDVLEKSEKTFSWTKRLFYTFIGLLAVIGGGHLVSVYSERIALSLGMSETLVGLTVVAIGTSLPELVTTLTAAIKKHSDLALGNIIGSNIFNILFVLGISSLIQPIAIDNALLFDALLMVNAMLILWLFSFSHQKTIVRMEAIFLIGLYLAYLWFVIAR